MEIKPGLMEKPSLDLNFGSGILKGYVAKNF